MEILFIGGAIVALMVYVSTRIKKSAAAAYEPEIIETSDFKILKPEGFINPINDDSKYAFEAYSKDFGAGDAYNVRQASVNLNTAAASNFDAYCRNAKQSLDKVSTGKKLNFDAENQKAYLIEGEKTEKKITYYISQKIVEGRKQKKIYDLKISVLQENREVYEDRVKEILNSFRAA